MFYPKPIRKTLIRTRFPGRCTRPNCGGYIAAGARALYGKTGLEHATPQDCLVSKVATPLR